MIFLRCLEVGYRGPPTKRLFGMSGTESTHQTPNLGQIWSTCQGPKWLKSVPDLNRNFQGACYCTWGKLEYNLSQMEQLTSNWFLTDHVMTTHLTWQHLKLNLFPFQ